VLTIRELRARTGALVRDVSQTPGRAARHGRRLLKVPQRRAAMIEAAKSMTPLKVQIGSGDNRLPGWLNTDVDILDALRPWPIDGIDYVFADNVLEHLTLPGLRTVLANAHIAMRPGARIRVTVPDVEGPARIYLGGGQPLADVLERHRAAGYDIAYRQDVLRVIFCLNGHEAGYQWDEQSLTAEFVAAGFADVRRFGVGESDDATLRGLESRTAPIDDSFQLALEATRV
jgi:predicted SAM-dependent methyltransferase